ncbi:Permease of the major facilitator superfamily [Desulfamplus magnetovallimortis]|uniref:Permease of the major facilitator superfamily n=1 Tax=Desulfamplus magnetovallimortis TaxID=1246637 RepID=A0A1W1H7R9_9BACT|nr:MFS transporter [Desulfamplus magnetovallimortis]SLM28509.1 Permease of the major facilitator superfamily [Desulfamplus magnetovallimortis]
MEPELNYIGRLRDIMSMTIPSSHKKIFLTLFFIIFSTVTGVGIVVPLLPIYANDLGASGIYVGLIFGSFSFSRTILLPYFGSLSDKKGRRPFIFIGLAGYVVVSVAFIITSSVSSLIIIRFVQGIASSMIMPVVQAYVGEITPEGREGYSMSLFNMSMFSSLSLGPIMGGIIHDIWSLDAAFACMGILSFIGMGLCILFLPPTDQEFIKHRDRPPIPWHLIAREPKLFGLFSYRFSYTACIGIIWCFLPIFAQSRVPELSGSSTGILVMLGVFISGILQLPMGYLADRMNKTILVVTGGIICAVSMLMIYTSTSYFNLLLAVSVFGIGGGISMPSLMALTVIHGNEKGAMGSVMSIVTVAHSLGMMAGSMGAGFAMDYFSLDVVFPCGTLLMGAGLIFFWGVTFLSLKKQQ